jgi:hypothetical protein
VINGVSSVDAATAINAVRCPIGGILDNINTFWKEAAAAVGADAPGDILGPAACPRGIAGSDAYGGQ